MDLIEKAQKLNKWIEEIQDTGDVYIPNDILEIMKDSVKAFIALDKIDNNLHIIMESDKRTFKNQITDDQLFYEGIYKAIKIVEEHSKEVY